MFNDTPAQKHKSAIGCQTNGKLKENMCIYIKKKKIHKVINYSVKSCTIVKQ